MYLNKLNGFHNGVVKILPGLIFSMLAANSYGAAFMLNEQNVSGLGNAFAGRTAIAEDASTSFFNPAGLVRINNHQVVGALSVPTANFEMTPVSITRATGAQVAQGKNKQNAGDTIPIPAFHIGGPLINGFYYGLSITSPFGLKTEYDINSRNRYFGTESQLKTIDVNPNIAYKIDNQWSVGAGVSAQYAEARLYSMLDTQVLPGALVGVESLALDAKGHNKADNIGFGYNFGALYQPTNNTRLGFNFRSKIKHNTDGEIRFSVPAGALANPVALGLVDQKATATVTLPEVYSVSSFQTLNSDWDIMADLTFTRWSRFKKLVIHYPDTRLNDSRVEEGFKNAIKVAVGANYKYSNNLTWRFGLAYDDSPVRARHRNIRIPDSDRYWAATGAKYVYNKNLTLDAGYTYIKLKDASVREGKFGRPLENLYVEYESSIHLFGVQGTFNVA